jgi:hypothetical protein
MYEDYLKIPFIKNSKLVSCGILEEMCEKKINDHLSYDSSDYYTEEIKEKVYSFMKIEFESFGYSK